MTDQWQEIRRQILNDMDLSREITDQELGKIIARSVSRYSREHLLSLEQRENYQRYIFNSLRRLDLIQELLDDEEITEIMINGPHHIFTRKTDRSDPGKRDSFRRRSFRT